MKKLFAALLVLCMVFALAACGSGNGVVGTWTGTVDATEYIVNDTPEMAGYLKSAPVSITMELTAGGKYTMKTDGTTIIPSFKDAMRGYFTDYCAQSGVTVEQLEEIMGMTLDQLIDSTFDEMDMSSLTENISGSYTESNGTITFDPGSAGAVVGMWNGDIMTFTIDIGNVTLHRK